MDEICSVCGRTVLQHTLGEARQCSAAYTIEELEQEANRRHNILLSWQEVLALADMVRQRRRKHERQLSKSTYIPVPGKRNMDKVQIDRLLDLEQRLRSMVGEEAQP